VSNGFGPASKAKSKLDDEWGKRAGYKEGGVAALRRGTGSDCTQGGNGIGKVPIAPQFPERIGVIDPVARRRTNQSASNDVLASRGRQSDFAGMAKDIARIIVGAEFAAIARKNSTPRPARRAGWLRAVTDLSFPVRLSVVHLC